MSRRRGRKPKVISFGFLCYWAENAPMLPIYLEYQNEEPEKGFQNGIKTAKHFCFDMLTDEECAGYGREWRCWTYKPTSERAAEVPWEEERKCPSDGKTATESEKCLKGCGYLP